jgi:hypothetical protein
MAGQVDFWRPYVLAASILTAGQTSPTVAATYKASLIELAEYESFSAEAIDGNDIFGNGTATLFGSVIPILIKGATGEVVNLNPGDDWVSQAADVSGNSQVGSGSGLPTGGNQHALLWHGTPESFVDLNPPGFSNSFAFGVSGNHQVGLGWGDATDGAGHVLLWHGSAESVVDLHPDGFASSQAIDIDGDEIVGAAAPNDDDFIQHALLWTGLGEGLVELHPPQYYDSVAVAVDQGSQVGTGSVLGGTRYHALLWQGTAESVVDLHPAAGFQDTFASGVAGALQVGFGGIAVENGPPEYHALVWSGSAESVVDLHLLLSDLGPAFYESLAIDVNDAGVIVGVARAGDRSYGVIWTPVPEPASIAMLLLASAITPFCRWRLLGRFADRGGYRRKNGIC